MLGLPASVKAPALAATGGCATYSTLMMMLSVKIPGGARDAHGPPRAGGRPHGANDDGRRHHGGSLWRLHGHRY